MQKLNHTEIVIVNWQLSGQSNVSGNGKLLKTITIGLNIKKPQIKEIFLNIKLKMLKLVLQTCYYAVVNAA